MPYVIRVATLEEREALEKWANGPTAPKIAKEFPFMWRRNQNWETERNRPSVAWGAQDTSRILGFHGTAYTKMGYANLYYIAVDTQFQGQHVGKQLMADAIKRAHALGMTRWTNKSHQGDTGEAFFTGRLGVQAVGMQGKDVVYDWSLEGINTCDDIIAAAKAGTLNRVDQIPERKIRQYSKYWNRVLASGITLGDLK
jgi:GNAT superfamily N-acetyltransferase